MPQQKAPVFGTRFGFYLAAIGSAFGLGNLWRFPYVVAENGGGAFVLLYLFFILLLGLPFLVAELTLGKISRSSLMPTIFKLTGDRYQVRDIREFQEELPAWLRAGLRLLPWFSLVITIVVLAYYAVISGWVLHFFMQLLVSLIDPSRFHPESTLQVLLKNGWLQLLLTSVHLLIVAVIVGKDLEIGLEKWVGYCMPAFVLLLLGLASQSVQLDSAPEALRFLFYPNFSKLTLASPGQALGHVFFTLSIGFGSMVTFGSYLREQAYIPMAGFRVVILDAVISLFAGVMIFPLVIYGEGTGPELLFQTVPRLVSELPDGRIFGVGFFLCLYLASLGASIGLFETVVGNWREVRRVPRRRGTIAIGLITFMIAVIPALSSNVLSNVKIGSRGLLAFLDAGLINWCLPVSALLITQVAVHLLRRELVTAQFIDPKVPGSIKLYRHWLFVLKYLATPIVLAVLIMQVVSLF